MPFSPRLGGFDDEPLREFITDKRVHSVESWHFTYEGTPYWSVLISYSVCEDAVLEDSRRPAKARTDRWRQQLKDSDWPMFNAFREWRKTKANEECFVSSGIGVNYYQVRK